MFNRKEYGPEDYVFRDENGNEYISTPEYNILPDLMMIWALATSMPFLIGLTLYLTL